MQSFQIQVSLVRLLGRVKAAFSNAFAICHNLNQPLILVSANTKKARFVFFSWFSHVLQITKSINLTQISKRVVQLVSVNVIDMIGRFFSGYVHPRQSMRQSFCVVNGNRNVTSTLQRPRNFSDKIRSSMIFCPNKYASQRVVVKRFAQMFYGKFWGCSHDLHFTIQGHK